jgi:hypothetical protein
VPEIVRRPAAGADDAPERSLVIRSATGAYLQPVKITRLFELEDNLAKSTYAFVAIGVECACAGIFNLSKP